jgi:hypothetical protein
MALNRIILLSLLLLPAVISRAQKDNPFESIGKKGKILTLSHGKYVETFDYDSVERIGTVLINIRTRKIVRLLRSKETFQKYSDNSSASRWWSPDPLANKFEQWSPYNFVENNPITNMDPDGDSLIVGGSNSAVQTFQNIANTGLGGFYTLGTTSTGKYVLNSTGQEGTMNDQQQALYNTLNEVATSSGDIHFTAIDQHDDQSKDVVIGDNGKSSQSATPGQHVIDVGDMAKVGSTGLITAQGMLGHEIKEGFEIQSQNLTSAQDIRNAHFRDAFGAENAINGTTRLAENGTDFNQSSSNPHVATITVRVLVPDSPGSSQGHIQTVTIRVRDGNVTNVSGNRKQ